MRRAKRIHDPGPVVAMGDERADADDRVVDVFRKLVADRFAHFIVRARAHAVRRGVAAQIGHSLKVPDDDAVAHGGSFAQGHAPEKPGPPDKTVQRDQEFSETPPVISMRSASGFYLLIRTPSPSRNSIPACSRACLIAARVTRVSAPAFEPANCFQGHAGLHRELVLSPTEQGPGRAALGGRNLHK